MALPRRHAAVVRRANAALTSFAVAGAAVWQRKLKLKATFETGSPHFSLKR